MISIECRIDVKPTKALHNVTIPYTVESDTLLGRCLHG